MSIKLMSLAWDLQGMNASNKLLLLAMCDWANDSGFCYPSMKSVAHRTCISKRQCQRIMSELIEGGLIAIVGNERGGIASRKYQLNVAALRGPGSIVAGDNLSPLASVSLPPVPQTTVAGDTHVTRTTTNHQVEPSLQRRDLSELDWSSLSNLRDEDRVVVVTLIQEVEHSLHQDLLDELAGAQRAKAIKGQWPAWLQGVARRARLGGFVANHALAIQGDRRRRISEADAAEKRRITSERLNCPEARARSNAAMAAAVAALAKL